MKSNVAHQTWVKPFVFMGGLGRDLRLSRHVPGGRAAALSLGSVGPGSCSGTSFRVGAVALPLILLGQDRFPLPFEPCHDNGEDEDRSDSG